MPRILERRFTLSDVEVRSKGGRSYIEGYAAVFNKRSQVLGDFVEVVERSAFNKTVQEADVRALQNHDPNLILGRTKSGTLQLSVDDSGLYYRVLSPDTSYARDLEISLSRGDISQSSFSFFKINDNWDLTEEGFPQRHLNEVGLVDVSPVTYPAYEDSTSQMATRAAALTCLADSCNVPLNEIRSRDDIINLIKRADDSHREPSEEDTSRKKLTPDEARALLEKHAQEFADFQ